MICEEHCFNLIASDRQATKMLELTTYTTPTAPCEFFVSFLVRIVRFCKPNCTNNPVYSVCSVYSVSRNGQFMWSKLPETASCFRGAKTKRSSAAHQCICPDATSEIGSADTSVAIIPQRTANVK